MKHYNELLIYYIYVTKPFDILIINETRLDGSVRDCENEIPVYEIITCDRTRYGDGAAIYIRKPIHFLNRKDLLCDTLEAVCIEIRKPKSKPVLIATWYRPPNSNLDLFKYFERLLTPMDAEDKEIILAGDLNCNFLDQIKSKPTSKLLDIINIFQLQQHIQLPTRTTSSTSSLIDVIFTRIKDNRTLDLGVIDLLRKISLPNEPPKIVFTKQFKNYNECRFREDLDF